MLKTLLLNPFKKIAGTQALVLGAAVMVAAAVVAYFSQCHFDGVLDAHVGHAAPLYVYLIETFVSWAVPVLCFGLAAKLFSTSHVRWIDLAGTIALARYPFLLIAVAAFMVPDIAPASIQISGSLLIASMLMLAGVIWFVMLLYHAVMVSCNFKGPRGVTIFIITLVVAEVVSKIFFNEFFRWF